MQGFSSSFLLFFYQIAIGGMLALASTPFHEIERAFYKSTAGVLYVIAVIGFASKIPLYTQGLTQQFSGSLALEAALHLGFIVSFSCYLASLWIDRQVFRARSFAATFLIGVAGLLVSTQSFYSASFFSITTLVYMSTFFLSSMLLGSVSVGMLMGHWYLIDTGQSLEPFVRVYKFFVAALIAQTIFMLLAAAALYFFGSEASVEQIRRMAAQQTTLLSTRILVGQAAPLILGWMIWRTLLIPHTMAATGLFYIALLGVFVGEILGRQVLALVSLPV